REEHPLADRSGALEQAVADAGVAGEDQIEEGRQPHGTVRTEIEHKQQIKLARLVDEADDPSDREAKAGERTEEIQFHLAASRMAFHSRSACASRGETSGYSGSAPMVVRIFHERAHFVPDAN